MQTPHAITSEAYGVSVEPLTVEHAGELFELCGEDDFKYYTSQPTPFNHDGWKAFITARNSLTLNGLPGFGHLLRYHGQVAGMSTVFDYDAGNRKLEIGYTMIGKPFRGTPVNPASKLQLMGASFEQWNILRVQVKGDAKNERSMRAMTRMGFHDEGVLRKFMILANGYERDNHYFSVIAEEWPMVKARLVEMCEARALR